jgi:hypothetical protein
MRQNCVISERKLRENVENVEKKEKSQEKVKRRVFYGFGQNFVVKSMENKSN